MTATEQIRATLLPPIERVSLSHSLEHISEAQSLVAHQVSQLLDLAFENILDAEHAVKKNLQSHFNNAVTIYNLFLNDNTFPIKEWLNFKSISIKEFEAICLHTENATNLVHCFITALTKKQDKLTKSSLDDYLIIIDFLNFLFGRPSKFDFLHHIHTSIWQKFIDDQHMAFMMFIASFLLAKPEALTQKLQDAKYFDSLISQIKTDMSAESWNKKLLLNLSHVFYENFSLQKAIIGNPQFFECFLSYQDAQSKKAIDVLFAKLVVLPYNTEVLKIKYEQKSLSFTVLSTQPSELHKL